MDPGKLADHLRAFIDEAAKRLDQLSPEGHQHQFRERTKDMPRILTTAMQIMASDRAGAAQRVYQQVEDIYDNELKAIIGARLLGA